MRPTVVIADTVSHEDTIEREILEPIARVITVTKSHNSELRELVKDADALLTCYTQITEDIVNAMKNCKIIARTGIGVDTIPIKLATSKGIKVTNVPDYCLDEVADHTMTLMLSLLRGIDQTVTATRKGYWNIESAGKLRRIRGQRLGLVGFGNISRAVASRALSFGLDLIVFDPFIDDSIFNQYNLKRYDLEYVISNADILSLHIPLNEKTRHIIDKQTLSLMKPNAILINTSRGGLVDIAALCDSLQKKMIAGAGIDVFEKEPPENIIELAHTTGLLVTPHVAFYSEESIRELRVKAATEIALALQGKPSVYKVN